MAGAMPPCPSLLRLPAGPPSSLLRRQGGPPRRAPASALPFSPSPATLVFPRSSSRVRPPPPSCTPPYPAARSQDDAATSSASSSFTSPPQQSTREAQVRRHRPRSLRRGTPRRHRTIPSPPTTPCPADAATSCSMSSSLSSPEARWRGGHESSKSCSPVPAGPPPAAFVHDKFRSPPLISGLVVPPTVLRVRMRLSWTPRYSSSRSSSSSSWSTVPPRR